jgi:hypothetical protein
MLGSVADADDILQADGISVYSEGGGKRPAVREPSSASTR